MTVETQSGGEPIVKSGPYNGNGVTTNFDYDFQIQVNDELTVTTVDSGGVETVLALTTDYTVTGVGDDEGGQIVLVDPASDAPSGTTLFIQYNGDYNQEVDYSNQGRIQLGLLEASLDKIVMHLRALKERVDRAVLASLDTVADLTLPSPAANLFIGWNSAGTALENKTPNSGDFVTVPGSSNDTAIVRFAGTSGSAFQNSGILVNNSDDIGIVRDLNMSRDIATARDITLSRALVNPFGVPIGTTGGTLAYVLTTGGGLSALVDGMEFEVIVNATSTGAVTLNVDGIGAVGVFRISGVASFIQLGAGDWPINAVRRLRYDGTQFIDVTESQARGLILDEDDFVSNSAIRAPSQQSVLAAIGGTVYEQGSWNPDFYDNSTAATFSSRIGEYTRIGNKVIAAFQMTSVDTSGLTAGDVANLRGWPFTPDISGLQFTASIYHTGTGVTQQGLLGLLGISGQMSFHDDGSANSMIVSDFPSTISSLAGTMTYIMDE